MFNWLIRWWKGKKFTPLIREYASIERTKIARFKGIDDEFNKKIVHYKNGEIVKEYPYLKSVIKMFKEVEEIPIIDKENFLEEDEEFFWDEPTEFGMVKER